MAEKIDEGQGYRELRKQRNKEVEIALDVNGYSNFLGFDDDIFLLDYWGFEQGLFYLVGISEMPEFFAEDIDGTLHVIKTLEQETFTEAQEQHIIEAFMRKVSRLQKIWNSGGHPQSNPPMYYIEWALSKKIDIPWLQYAIDHGFYKPNTTTDNQQPTTIDKPLSNKERETLLVIIAALAKDSKVDISKTSKAGELIANMTDLLGSPVGATTIETLLKKIPKALESRAK